ncbi:IS5 family transposase [Roseateles saccharophilus]|uniref:IS4 family transposase n=1 Tax=Roseateles saccharophilus TaxID=304 RepID=A0A4R3VDK8_ROSSA|nr:IS5 family transposase [Roseateles saccharophilus]MDG0832008.1 IS5 family transposase [Roseateles saccharophilus]TCV03416.1 IS4 family transposase [Roseateles saccharophilus]
MGPKPADERSDHDLFRTELVNLIDQRHELAKLAELIDWPAFAQQWGSQFESTTGRPALATRLMAALLYLKHVYALSDEDVVERWVENPYWQHFSGERYFRHELPCDPSSLVRWRKRIGEAGCEWLLAHSIEAASKAGVIKRRSLDTVVLDTTVQPKAIAHPTDSRLLNRAREQLVAAAQDAGIVLRQSYARVGKAAETQAGRYAHAKQFNRMRREIRKLRTWLGRVIRDVQRKAAAVGGEVAGALKDKLDIAQRLHAQQRDSKNKLYALHAPEVECLAKGMARTPYEFGVKVSVAVTATEGLVVGMRSMPGNPYDGHTVDSQLEQVEILTGKTPKIALADRGYRGVEPACGARLLISHTRRLPKRLKKLLKRRQVVEPMIGHMKADGLLGKNWLKGADGDALNALLCGAGHNLRMILRHLRVLYCALWALIAMAITLGMEMATPTSRLNAVTSRRPALARG